MNNTIIKRAFTLIEVIMVLAIIGTLSLFAIPEYLSYARESMEKQAQHDLSLMRYALREDKANYDDGSENKLDINTWPAVATEDIEALVGRTVLYGMNGVVSFTDLATGQYRLVPEGYAQSAVRSLPNGSFYYSPSGEFYYCTEYNPASDVPLEHVSIHPETPVEVETPVEPGVETPVEEPVIPPVVPEYVIDEVITLTKITQNQYLSGLEVVLISTMLIREKEGNSINFIFNDGATTKTYRINTPNGNFFYLIVANNVGIANKVTYPTITKVTSDNIAYDAQTWSRFIGFYNNKSEFISYKNAYDKALTGNFSLFIVNEYN